MAKNVRKTNLFLLYLGVSEVALTNAWWVEVFSREFKLTLFSGNALHFSDLDLCLDKKFSFWKVNPQPLQWWLLNQCSLKNGNKIMVKFDPALTGFYVWSCPIFLRQTFFLPNTFSSMNITLDRIITHGAISIQALFLNS